jgi:hypothetical protein
MLRASWRGQASGLGHANQVPYFGVWRRFLRSWAWQVDSSTSTETPKKQTTRAITQVVASCLYVL